VRKTPKRGVIEHYYSAAPRRQVSDDAWAETPDIVKKALVGPVTEGSLNEMVTASQNGGFDRADAHLSRNPMKLDEQGWSEAAKVFEEALRQILEIESNARERMKGSDRPPIVATSIIALFESTRPSGE
jgi:hypothetical protein